MCETRGRSEKERESAAGETRVGLAVELGRSGLRGRCEGCAARLACAREGVRRDLGVMGCKGSTTQGAALCTVASARRHRVEGVRKQWPPLQTGRA